ncbi:MAG: T9SS type A sorting domain-containing protein [Bacteroidales bacterium]|nr:T9SS type A sorting domain-containing protein [Bacteroidales bacterium]
MKKLLLTIVFSVVLGTLSFAQTVQKTYHFGTPTVSEVNGYDVIRFAGLYNNGVAGEAALPWQSVSLLLPQNTEAQVITVEYSDFVELDGTYNLMPAQAPRTLSSTKPFVFEKNEDFYKSNEVYPKNTFSKVNTQYLNGCSFAFAQFSPVRYVPATGKVSYAKSATVTIDVTASKSDRSNKLWMTPEIQGRVERLAQNPEAVKSYKSRARTIGGYELLVITPENWVSHFDEYVEFYEARGLRTHVTALEDILANFEGRDDAEKMRTYINQEYENEGIMMVLLGGDSNVVPWRALYCDAGSEADNLPADMYFVCLDGTWNDDNDELWGEIGEDDLLPELCIGRMPFNNENQFNNMMHKTLEYQANPVLGEFHDVILGAEHLGDGYYGSTDLEMLIGGSSNFDYTTVGIPEDYNFIKIYADGPTGWTGGIFKSAINQNGGQYVHHVGHANTDYVAGWYVNTTNDESFAKLDGVTHNYNFFHSHGCICGDFTHTCMLERLVNISTGFVATTGNSRYGWYQPWGDGMAAHLHREFVDAYYNDRLPYIGTAFVEMKIMTAPYVTTPWGDNGAMRWNLYDINILGDVAVCPWLDEPFNPEVDYMPALTLGTTQTTVTINKIGVPQNNFRVSLFYNGELLAFDQTGDDGEAELVFDEPLNIADTLKLIITGPNAIPQTINVLGISENSAFVYPINTDIHGDFNFGRNVSMDASFKNIGMADATNVTATLSTASEYVSLSKSVVEIGNVNAGATVLIQDAFDFNIADNIPDATYVGFMVSCSDGTNVWNSEIHFLAKAPVLKIDNMVYEELNGNMNGFLDPGETFKVKVYGTNVGHYVAEDPYMHCSVSSNYVTVVENDIHFDNVDVNGNFEQSFELVISDDTPDGTMVTINMNAISSQYSGSGDMRITVGTAKEDFESGGLTNLDWQLSGDADWFVTDSEAHSGNYCAQSGNIIKNQVTSLIIEFENTTSGKISFYFKTSTTYHKDYLVFYIDNELQGMWSGDNNWTGVNFDVAAGNHVIEWRYDTAPNGGTGGNVCWVDDITFPGNTVIMGVESTSYDKDVTIYPNPANDVIYIKGDDVQYVEIYNSIGLKVISMNVNNSESIDIADLANGLYFVRTSDKNGNVSTTKIVKR